MPTKTKTSPSGLTPLEKQELKELDKRGFLVRDVITFWDFSKLYWIYGGIILASMGFSILFLMAIPGVLGFIMISIVLIIPLFFLFRAVFFFIFIGKFFYSEMGIFAFRKMYQFGEPIKYLNWIRWALKFKGSDKRKVPFTQRVLDIIFDLEELGSFLAGIILIPLILFSVVYILVENGVFIQAILISCLMIGVFGFGIPIIAFLLRQLVEHFHPLYAFGNLGSKIQSLTPRITEESQKIEKEFSKDMNFRTLSDSFDTLSKDFSKISSCVIKLEQIEQKANKGNLFDSEKYIGSLREDIVKPLTALRVFLQKKKEELQFSQEEMKKVRVRVGGSGNGETENLELQSKRSEPLINELTENIEKLDVMIEKFGKI